MLENADAELGFCAHRPRLDFGGVNALLFVVFAGGMPEDEAEGDPPDEVVGEDGPGKGWFEAAHP